MHKHRPIKLALQIPERRKRERPNLGQLPPTPSPDTDSGVVLPRLYLMTSKTAWIALAFAIALCCGCAALLRQENILSQYRLRYL